MKTRVLFSLFAFLLSAAALVAQPTVTGTTPSRNATNIAANANINIGFSQDMDAASLDETTVIVVGSYRGTYSGVYSMSNATTLLFNPDVDFLPGEVITATVTTGAQSTLPQALARSFTFSFTAAAQGYGLFKQPVTFAAVPSGQASDVAAADLNGDGEMDLAVLSQGNNTISVHFSNGDGTFGTPVVLDNRSGAIAMKLQAADVDGNGHPDLLVTNISAFSLSVFLNNGDDTFATRADYGTSASLPASDMVVMDIDGNGDLDVVQLHYGSPGASQFLFHYMNTGNGVFATGSQITIANLPSGGSLALSYHNATTMFSNSQYQWRPHLLVTDYGNNQLRVYENTGSGTGYEYAQTRFTGTNPVAVAGFRVFTTSPGADAVVLNSGSDNFTVYRAPEVWSAESFASQSNFSAGDSPYSLAGGDLDGNGSIDLIVVNGGDGTLSYLPNTTGTFFVNNSLSVGANASQAVMADMDGDGRLDVVTANTNGTVSILYNYPGPEIASVSPANNATNVSSYADIVIEFSVDFMDATTMNASTIQVLDANDDVIPSTFDFDGSTLTITPNAPFQQNSSVSVTVSADVKTTTNLAIINPTTFSFTTAESLASIVSVSPSANAFLDPSQDLITIEFADDMILAPFEDGIQVIGSARGAYAGDWSFNSGTKTATFTPVSDFIAGEIITVLVGTTLENTIGGNLEDPYQWSFRVDAAGDGGFMDGDVFASDVPSAKVVKLADMNGDGLIDIVVVGYDYDESVNQSVVSVSLNDGVGGYLAPVITSLQTEQAENFITSDFDGDGHTDLAVVQNYGGNAVSFHFGDGLGSFGSPVLYTVTETYLDFIASGDLTGDGLIDVAVARYGSSDVIVLRNNGNRTFTAQSPVATGAGSWSLVIADVNNDGNLDIVTGDYDDQTISVLMNGGTGTFAAAESYTAGIPIWNTAAGDVNGDGFIDIIVDSEEGDKFVVMLNNQSGEFAIGSTIIADGNKPTLVKMTETGGLDLVTINSGDLRLFSNNGNGTFSSTPKNIAVTGYAQSFAALDLDGDQDVDLVAISDDGNVQSILNVELVSVVSTTPTANALDVSDVSTITATFSVDMDPATFTSSNMPVYTNLRGVVSGIYSYNAGSKTVTFTPASPFLTGEVVNVTITKRLNSVNDVPLETSRTFSFTISASGNGYFELANTLNTGSDAHFRLLSADVDGDGDEDLIGFASNVLNVFKNTAGVYSAYATLSLGSEYPEDGIVGDFDNDGDPDVLVWSFNMAGSLLENDGSGNFTQNTTFNYGSSGQKAVTVADLDGDGNLDIAYNTGNAILYISFGAGNFTFPQSSFPTLSFSGDFMYPRKLVSGDFNHDGLVDVAGFNDQRDHVFVMMNNGNRSFSASEAYSVPVGTQDIAVANLTGSAHPDLVVASFDSNSFTILTSDGDGTFSNIVTYGSLPYQLKRVSAFDFSGNGKPDLVFHAEDDIEEVELLFMAYNDGNGGFGNQVTFSIPNEEPEWYYGLSQGYAVLDANNDGALDIASRLSENGNETIAFIENTAPVGGGSAPTVAVTNPATTATTFNSASISWTNGDGLRRLIVVKEGAAVDATLVDDSNYGPNPAFGQGTQVGSGNYFVFGGNGSSTTISGLTAETTYHYAIYEINGIPGAEKILTTTPATGSFTTATAPIVFRIADESIVFTKANYADWSQEANQDRITDLVWITRKNSQGIFNVAREAGYDNDSHPSPVGTMWAYGTADDVATATFDTWYNTHGGSPPDMVDQPMLMYLVAEDVYVEVIFTSWTDNANGGGFSYTRGAGAIPNATYDFDTVAGQALSFDGNGNFAQFSTYNNETDEYYEFSVPITLEMWVKPSSLPSTGEFDLVMSSRSRDLYIGINEDHKFFTSIRPNPFDFFEAIGTTTVETDKWYHVSVSVKGNGEIRLYVNAELEASTAVTTTYSLYTDWINLGGGYMYPSINYGHFFHGQMDEFRIWKSERTASQIRSEMFTAPLSANVANAALAWQMNEGTGTSVVDLINGFNLDLTSDGASTTPTWVASTIPFGAETQSATGVQSGTAIVGGATLSFNTPFENEVDVFFNEITSEPNLYPDGYTASLGGKYFVIDLVGDPGTFSLDLTLTFGSGVVTPELEATPSLLKLYRRNSGSGATWTEIASASSAIAATGVVTWPNITSFSEFMAVEFQPPAITEIESLNITAFSGSTYAFDAGLFDIDAFYGDETFTLTVDGPVVGTIFVDTNNNEAYDEGTDDILTHESSAAYTPSDIDARLRFTPSTSGVDSVIVTFTFGDVSADVELRITTVEAYPSLAGVAGENGWYLLSNPLNTPLGTLFQNIWTQGAPNSDAPGGQATLFTFNQTTSAYEAITTDLETTTLPAGTGILAYVYAFDNPTDGVPMGGGWPKQLSNEGNPFSLNASITVRNVDADDDDMTSGSEGFALLGNPYAWSLSADSVIATLKRADPLANSYVYRWNPVSKRYQLLTGGAINAYESVFVRLITSDIERTVEFDYNDGLNVITADKSAADESILVPFTLNTSDATISSEMAVRIGKDGAAGIDPFDGYYLGSYASRFANLYMGNGDQGLVINNLPESLDREVSVPIYLHTTVSGEFDLSWNTDALPSGWVFVLEETATGTRVNLADAASFRFTSSRLSKSTSSPHGSVPEAQGNEPTFMLHIVPANVTSLEDGELMPVAVELNQNYPNPFNPSTVIRYGVPSQSAVTLEVFDILGRHVATLVNNQVMPAGRHSVSFDAGRLASGVYVYRLVVGEKVMTKRMVLIK